MENIRSHIRIKDVKRAVQTRVDDDSVHNMQHSISFDVQGASFVVKTWVVDVYLMEKDVILCNMSFWWENKRWCSFLLWWFFQNCFWLMLHKKVLFTTVCDIVPLGPFFGAQKRWRLGKKFPHTNFRFFTPFSVNDFQWIKVETINYSKRKVLGKERRTFENLLFLAIIYCVLISIVTWLRSGRKTQDQNGTNCAN